ncbi:hypothetical protein [Methanocella sp. MCL-LM]|uniref:hypothetical protein n=1 Tax=Methanocella sp. MCL-LM TaxID=3412035 RepID=UPI003C70E245
MIIMTGREAEVKEAIWQKLEEISARTETIKARVKAGDSDISGDTRELDRLVRELKAFIGQSAFDKTAYQREYMRKKRAEDPEYRPIMQGVKSLPDWRKPPLE